MKNQVDLLRNFHRDYYVDETIYILGSGKSLDFIEDSFFDDKFTIGVNKTYKRYNNLNFNLWHHHDYCDLIDSGLYHGSQLVVSEYDCCKKQKPQLDDIALMQVEYYQYSHCDLAGMGAEINIAPLHTPTSNTIMVANNTIVDAIGLAFYMGAKNIILCGCDAGSINGETNYTGYHDHKVYKKPGQQGHSLTSYKMILLLRDELKLLGRNLYMLNPWLDFNLEGNNYSQQMPDSEKAREHLKFKLIK